MSIRKPNFKSFLLPVVLVSFAPLLGHADDAQSSAARAATPPSNNNICSLPAGAPAQFQARFAAADNDEKKAICAKIAANAKQGIAPNVPPAPMNLPAVDLSQSQSSDAGQPDLSGMTSGADRIKALRAGASASTNSGPSTSGASGSIDAGPQPIVNPASVSVVLAPNKAHYLSAADAQDIFGADDNLSIITLPAGAKGDGSTSSKPTSATLGAIYPNACRVNFSVSSTSSDATLKAPAGTVGFAIYDTGNTANGGLRQCMQDHAGDCAQDYSGAACSSMSDLARISIPKNGAVHVAYLDFGKRHDTMSAQSSWTAQDIKGSMNILSDDMIAANKQAALDAEQVVLKDQVANCIHLGDLPVAREHLKDITDIAARTKLMGEADAAQAKQDQAQMNIDLTKLDSSVEEAAESGDPKAADTVEQSVKDFAAKHPDQADAAADRIELLAIGLTGGKEGPSLNSAPSAAAIKDAKRMLSEAMDDDGLGMSDDKAAEFKKFENTELVKREVQASVARLYNLEIQAQQLAQKDPSKAQRAEQQAANEQKNAVNLQKKAVDTLTSQLKKMGCIKETSTAFGKSEEDSQKAVDNEDLGNACDAVKQDRTEVENVNAEMQKQYQAAVQNLIQQQQQAQQQALAQQRAAMGQNGQQGAAQQVTFGPSLSNGGATGIGSTGMVGGLPMNTLPTYTGGFMNTSPTTSFGMPMQQSYNPYSYTGVAGMGSMAMPMSRGSSI